MPETPVHQLYMWKETVAKRGPQAGGPGKERKPLRVRVSAALQTSKEPTDSKDLLSLLGHLPDPCLPGCPFCCHSYSLRFSLHSGKKSQASVGNRFSDYVYLRTKAIIWITQDRKRTFASTF